MAHGLASQYQRETFAGEHMVRLEEVRLGSAMREIAILERRQFGATPTFLVSDQVMPGMSGAALAKAVRGLCADTKILLISGFTAENNGASEFARLSKPFAKDALATALAML